MVKKNSAIVLGALIFLLAGSGWTQQKTEEIPDDIILVSESGIKSPADALRLAAAGADSLLIGETLMRSSNILVDLPQFRASTAAAREYEE